MNWTDYLKENGNVEGNEVWVVDARRSEGLGFLRHIPPTLVRIFHNKDLPKNKKVYYSNYHFRKIGKRGEPIKQIIAPFDNTGFRSYSGKAVYVYDNYKDAVNKYNEQLDIVKKSFQDEVETLYSRIGDIEDLKIVVEEDDINE